MEMDSKNEENGGVVSQYLIEIGCCWRCVLIFLGEAKVELLKEEDNFIENFSKCFLKKQKTQICIVCCGILQNCSSPNVIQKFCSDVENEGFDSESFSLSLVIPASLCFRMHTVWVHLLRKFPDFNDTPSRAHHRGVLKEMFRDLVGPSMAIILNKNYKAEAPLLLTINPKDTEQEASDCKMIEKLDPFLFKTRRQQWRKFNQGVFTVQVVKSVMQKTPDEDFAQLFPEMPSTPLHDYAYDKVQTFALSVFIAGRYCKLSRSLPHSKWLVEGEVRRFDSSIEEVIGGPLNAVVKADSARFSSSGREDVDVRCLGRGRPFVLEFVNPRKSTTGLLSIRQMAIMQHDVNQQNLVIVKDLQLSDKVSLVHLSRGAEEKRKRYVAVCRAEGITTDDLKRVEEMAKDGLILDQLTPVRVLHRRSLAVRKKNIYSLKLEVVKTNFFKAWLYTEAGTYIKEFIHGDWGRTTPNLTQMVGRRCDILALDVEAVECDWPPSVQIEDAQ